MRKNQETLWTLILLALLLFSIGCGGSKEIVQTEPDPFPEPEAQPIQEEPQPVIETLQPEAKDIAKKQPVVLNTVHFEFDKAELTSESKAILAENARQLLENPEINVRIEGHCDERGTVEYNLALGQRRAIVTRNYLIDYGLDSNRFTIISYGKERPVDPRHTPDAWSKNRRAEFIKINE